MAENCEKCKFRAKYDQKPNSILVDGVLKFQTLVDYFGSYALVIYAASSQYQQIMMG